MDDITITDLNYRLREVMKNLAITLPVLIKMKEESIGKYETIVEFVKRCEFNATLLKGNKDEGIKNK